MTTIKNNTGDTPHVKTFTDFLSQHFSNTNLPQVFEKITALYFEVNAVINISALRTIDDVYVKHYLDSIYPYKYFSGACCDVGCGGGFPCLPLAVVTGLSFTGLDSVGKKLTLLRRCMTELNIKNITAEHARAEDLAKLGKRFDTVCARAVSDTNTALAFCAPLAESGGKIILYKTQNDTAADKATEKKLNVTLFKTEDYTLPGTDIKRRLFIYAKS